MIHDSAKKLLYNEKKSTKQLKQTMHIQIIKVFLQTTILSYF